jgi:hypothetical protein
MSEEAREMEELTESIEEAAAFAHSRSELLVVHMHPKLHRRWSAYLTAGASFRWTDSPVDKAMDTALHIMAGGDPTEVCRHPVPPEKPTGVVEILETNHGRVWIRSDDAVSENSPRFIIS